MSQAIIVTRKEHSNGTFDVVYENPAETGSLAAANAESMLLFEAIAVSVAQHIHGNSYRDPEDHVKGQKFLEVIGLYNDLAEDENPPSIANIIEVLGTMPSDAVTSYAAMIKNIHISGSIFANQDTTQLRGLVTITYRDLETGDLRKVRLSGLLDEEVGLALRSPYETALQTGELTVIPAPNKNSFTEKVTPVSVSQKMKGEFHLSAKQMEELADMVALKLAHAFIRGQAASSRKPRK